MKNNTLLKLSGFCGLILPVITIVCVLLSLLEVPDFNWKENAISDLGRPGEAFCFFNLSIIFIGLLLMIFTLSFFKIFKKYKSTNTIMFISLFFL